MSENQPSLIETLTDKSKIHTILAYSYSIYFLFFLAGIVFDTFFPIRIFGQYMFLVGVALILWATILVVWAQNTSSILETKKKKGIILEYRDFHSGPYRFTRRPTHVGLAMLLVGFGFLINSIIIVVITGIPFLITHFVHLQKMEDILQGKYGELYKRYKNKVRNKMKSYL